MKTKIYSPGLSGFCRIYSNKMTARTLTGEFPVLMKFRSGRQFEFDLLEIIVFLWKQEKIGNMMSLETGSLTGLSQRSLKLAGQQIVF